MLNTICVQNTRLYDTRILVKISNFFTKDDFGIFWSAVLIYENASSFAYTLVLWHWVLSWVIRLSRRRRDERNV